MVTRESLYRINPDINVPKEMKLASTEEEPITKLETRLYEKVKSRMMKGSNIWSRRPVEAIEEDGLDISDIIGLINEAATTAETDPPSPSESDKAPFEQPQQSLVAQTNFRRLVSALSYSRKGAKKSKKCYTHISPSNRVKSMLAKNRRLPQQEKESDDVTEQQEEPDCDDAVDTSTDKLPVPLITYPGMETDSETGKPTLAGLRSDLMLQSAADPTNLGTRYRAEEADRRRAFRRLLFKEYTDKAVGIRDVVPCPMPAESWVRPDINRRAQDNACKLGSLNTEIQLEISQKRDIVIRTERNRELGKTTRVNKRKSILGLSSMAEWRHKSYQLKKDAVGQHRTSAVAELKKASDRYVLTSHQRRRMPLPSHLAYNTKAGCRNY
eukprot:TRINITY_DN24527_c0_g1_i1.p1 TRINITY_DN24527_c0_g1~~TRINITY_DN24527_c0_g1_i1.p1  ORF type:complete len:383 (+),score=68.95 TRINITY_DN24527_c0_g1_i1:96-1244(+)